MLILALVVEGIPHMPLFAWGVILGLSVVNSLIGFLLFNHSLQHLAVVEANILWNLMPVGTALIAWGALGEQLLPIQIGAMFLVVGGASLVQSSGEDELEAGQQRVFLKRNPGRGHRV